MSNPTHDTNDAGGGAVKFVIGDRETDMLRDVAIESVKFLVNDNARLRAFVASLKAKAQQGISITPGHFKAFERGETV